jgi:hypothetical protein
VIAERERGPQAHQRRGLPGRRRRDRDELRLGGRAARRGEGQRFLGGEHVSLAGQQAPHVGAQRLVVPHRDPLREDRRAVGRGEAMLAAEHGGGVVAQHTA